MYKVTICGHFGGNEKFLDGQTVKTKNLYKALVDEYGDKNINIIDTYNWKKHPFKLLINCIKASKNSKNIIILPAHNGIKIFVPLFTFLKKIYKFELHYAVVGGWLSDFLENKKSLLKKVKLIDNVFVETNGMKEKLELLGLSNVKILVNFKYLNILNNIKYSNKNKVNLCTFSRVTKEKGISNAINIVNLVNEKLGFNYCSLDIYGQVDLNYEKEFYDLLSVYKENICYKGCVDSSDSVNILRKYDFLIFPTYYSGEGLAGTIIDAFSSGIPVIATDWRYNGEVIKNEKNGFLYQTNNDEECSNILINIYSNKYDIREMKKECLEEAKKYKPDIAIKNLTKYLK